MSVGITVDNVEYNVIVTTNIERTFELKQGDQGGTAQTGREIPDILGTNYIYEMHVEPTRTDFASYDAFYEVISAPTDYHTVTVPYGQTTLTFEAMILRGKDKLKRKVGEYNRWGGLDIEFMPIEPQRTE